MILIFTNKEDTHPTPVIQHLVSWGVPFFRFNTESLLTDYVFRWWQNNGDIDFYLKNIINNTEIYGHEVTAVWERRPLPPSLIPIICPEEIQKYCLEEAHEFLSFLRYYLKDTFSIGSIVNDRYAASKMLQAKTAIECGFKVPKTLYTNSKEDLASIFYNNEYLAIKPISVDSLFYEDKEYVFYVNKHKTTHVISQPHEAFSMTASCIQEYIEKQYELRITVCCDGIVACKIDSQKQSSGKGKEDWRQGYDYGLIHEIITIPRALEDACKLYLQRMGLVFGCFDIIVTPQNEYFFLECNPNGQWYWIELETGADISGMIAKSLANPQLPNIDLL